MKLDCRFVLATLILGALMPELCVVASPAASQYENEFSWSHVAGVLSEKHDARNWRDERGRSIVYYQLLYGSEDDALQSLAKLAFKPGWREGKRRLMNLAIERSSQRIVKKLLSMGDPPRSLAEHEEAPLSVAAGHGEIEIMSILLANGADINERIYGESAAHSALYGSQILAFNLLISRGIDLSTDRADSTSENLLSIAVRRDLVAAIPMLVTAGFDLNRLVKGGAPALHFAITERRSYDLVRELLHHGADPCLKDNNGVTAIELARKLYPSIDLRAPPLYEDLFWEPGKGRAINCPASLK